MKFSAKNPCLRVAANRYLGSEKTLKYLANVTQLVNFALWNKFEN